MLQIFFLKNHILFHFIAVSNEFLFFLEIMLELFSQNIVLSSESQMVRSFVHTSSYMVKI